MAGSTSSSARAPGANGLRLLLRNDGTGRFLDRSTLLPATVRSGGAAALVVTDVDDDGDEESC